MGVPHLFSPDYGLLYGYFTDVQRAQLKMQTVLAAQGVTRLVEDIIHLSHLDEGTAFVQGEVELYETARGRRFPSRAPALRYRRNTPQADKTAAAPKSGAAA